MYKIFEVSREAAWAITNMFSQATAEQIHCIIYKHGLLKGLTHILTDFEDRLKQNALQAVRSVLETEVDNTEKESHVKEIKEAGLVEIIQNMAKDSDFSSNANLILDYFNIENPEEFEYKIETKKNQEDRERED